MKVNLDEEVANRLGFTNATIGRVLAGGFEGEPVTTYWEGERDIAVTLRLEPARAPKLQRCRQYLRHVARNGRARAIGQYCHGFTGVGPRPHCAP